MAYPDTPPTVDEIENNPILKREIFDAINKKPAVGFKRISDICEQGNLDEAARSRKIASFYLNNKENLDQEKVADHISAQDQTQLLQHFVDQYKPSLQGKSFTEGLRGYFENFKSPGEAQKVDRFVKAFAYAYVDQNPGTSIPSGDAAYQLSFQAIMLATDAHSPEITNKMTYPQLKDNIEYSLKLQKIDEKFLEQDGFLQDYYKDLTSTALAPRFQKVAPEIALDSAQLKKDRMLGAVEKELGKKQGNVGGALRMEGTTAEVNGRKPMLSFLTGYKSTVTLTDADGNKATVEISKPGLFSRNKPSVTVKPVGESEGSLKLAGQIAGKFDSKPTIKSSFPYQLDDMSKAVQQQKTGVKMEKSQGVQQNQPKESLKQDRVKLSREGYRGGENLKLETAKKEVMHELGDVLKKRNEKPSVGQTTGLKKPGEKQVGEGLEVSRSRRTSISGN
jgi:hypothetical protein